MASSDWALLTGSLLTTQVRRGVTHGIARPNSSIANNFLYGFNSETGTPEGVVGLAPTQANFAPTAVGKGGSIRGCIQRGVSGGNTGFAPFLFIGLQGAAAVGSQGYILGLSNGDPPHLVLRKGALNTATIGAAPDSTPPTNGVLRRSTGAFALGEWLHIRLDMVVNANGDVILDIYQNDLTANPIGAPEVWQTVPGMASFVDDALGVNTGTLPYTNGYMGFGFWVGAAQASRRGFFDAIQALRQL